MFLAVEIESVSDAISQAKAVEAQKALADCMKLIEDSRKSVKAPILDFGRKIDAVAKEFVANMSTEAMRIARLIGDFQALELAKQRAAEAARNEELTRIEHERQAALAKASSFEEREAIHERHQQEIEAAAAAAKVKQAPRVDGQRIQEDYEFEVTDLHLLAKMHPELVNIEPRRGAIREQLKLGRQIVGIASRKVVNATVRASKPKEFLVMLDRQSGYLANAKEIRQHEM